MNNKWGKKKWSPAFHACLLALGPPPKTRTLADARLIGEYRVAVRQFWIDWHSHTNAKPTTKSQHMFQRAYLNWVADKEINAALDEAGLGGLL